jgi:hypothetical protein
MIPPYLPPIVAHGSTSWEWHRPSHRPTKRPDPTFANLSDATLSDAVVENVQFGGYLGLTEEMKLDLKRHGAIFEDSPGDRSWVFIPR